jgi:hypothetical protein
MLACRGGFETRPYNISSLLITLLGGAARVAGDGAGQHPAMPMIGLVQTKED